MNNEIECPDCSGNGWVVKTWRFGLSIHKTEETCAACNGHGWREPTQEEINDRAADAYSEMCESEPPISFDERVEMEAKRDASWGVK